MIVGAEHSIREGVIIANLLFYIRSRESRMICSLDVPMVSITFGFLPEIYHPPEERGKRHEVTFVGHAVHSLEFLCERTVNFEESLDFKWYQIEVRTK